MSPDGSADLVVGCPGYLGTGAAFWYANHQDPDRLEIDGQRLNDRFGFSVLLTKDLTNDTLPDLLVGAPYHGATGAVFLYDQGTSVACEMPGQATGAEHGWVLSEAGDVDQNRVIDFLVGQPESGSATPGTAFLRPVLR